MLIPFRSPGCHMEVTYFFSKSGSLKEKKKIIWRVMDLMLMGNCASGHEHTVNILICMTPNDIDLQQSCFLAYMFVTSGFLPLTDYMNPHPPKPHPFTRVDGVSVTLLAMVSTWRFSSSHVQAFGLAWLSGPVITSQCSWLFLGN